MPFKFKFGYQMGIRNQKGTVSVENFRNRIRLRWRYQGKRFSLSLTAYTKVNLGAAKRVVLQIELYMANGQFDDTLVKYGGKMSKVDAEEVNPKQYNSVLYFLINNLLNYPSHLDNIEVLVLKKNKL